MAIIRVLSSMLFNLGCLMLLLACTSLAQESCNLSGGVQGVCRDIRQCQSVLNDIQRRIRQPVFCGRRVGRFPIVCCPADSGSGNPSGQPDISPPPISFECGKRGSLTLRRSIIKHQVVGGEPVVRASWPWMALLGSQDATGAKDWFCAGTLINEQWILTAAHCIGERRLNIVRLGEHDYEDPIDGAPHEDFEVETIIRHPNYIFPQAYHDIALIKLTRKVTFKNAIQPVCLPWGTESNKNLVRQKVTLTGWGSTEFDGEGSSVLQEVEVTVFSSEVCDEQYKSLRDYSITWPQGIGQESVCSGDSQGGKDACQGDSGGPIVSKDSKNRYTIAGIVSTGYGCGSENYLGLYANTRRPEYLAWIKKVAF